MPSRRSPPRRPARGFALIAVLWITILLTVIGSSFAFSMRSEALSARNALSLAQARAAADGAVERVAFELQRPRNLNEAWTADGQPHAWQDGEIAIVVTAVDEAAKIDLNAAAEPLLKGLLMVVGGLDEAAAQRLVDAIVDWRDPDELTPPERCRGGRVPVGQSQLSPAECAVRGGGRAAARARNDPGALLPDRAAPDRLFAASRRQPGDGEPRGAAVDPRRRRRAGRSVPRPAAGGAAREAAGPGVRRRRSRSAPARFRSGRSGPRRACPMV